jgi:hypothetical protein
MIGSNYIKANPEREISIPLLSNSAHEEYKFRTVQNLFVNE